MTRRLCAAAHLDEGFARQVREEFTGDRLTAIGLPLGVNLVALVRHALVALKHREVLDRRLSLLFIGLWAGVAALLWGVVSGTSQVAAPGGLGVIAVCGASWWLVHRAEKRARAAALGVFGTNAKPEDLAPAAPKVVEDRLHELRRANVVPYTASAERDSPFVGSGTEIKDMVWQPIDVSKPADSPTGGKLTIKPFDAVDLHTYVAREMANIAGLEGLRTRNRLYVLGTHVRHLGTDLLPDPLDRPRAQVPKQLVKAGLVQPGAGMRTYLSMERVGEGGRVIVSMHVRARLHHPSLSWEVAAYAIPPVGHNYGRVESLPRDGFEQWWSLVRFATSTTWSALTGAPRRCRRRRAARARRARELDRLRREIRKHHLAYDYGARDSLRERVSSWQEMGHSDRTDSQDFLHRLQQGVLIATERFLKDHNVDTSSFDQAQQVISTQTYNFSGDITGPSNFGNSGQIAYGQQAAGPHQRSPWQQAPGAPGPSGQGAGAQP